jgi:geranylgeranyl diphosphate synthase type II
MTDKIQKSFAPDPIDSFSPANSKAIIEYLNTKRALVETALQQYMPELTEHIEFHIESMAYSLSAGGKRVRPVLCIAAAEALGQDMTNLMPIPCALECIHTYSLIHDDLPAMDNDELRRGKPTNHMVYGEAAAILAGDSLLTFAFELLSHPSLTGIIAPQNQVRIINTIAQAAGPMGMAGGQALDIASENKDIPFKTLQFIHSRKTGALITASVQCGALLGNASKARFDALSDYGRHIGLAFQIVDDLLNVEGTMEELGKAVGSDADRNKATYPAFFGVSETRNKAKETVQSAIDALSEFDMKADPLRNLAAYIYARTN